MTADEELGMTTTGGRSAEVDAPAYEAGERRFESGRPPPNEAERSATVTTSPAETARRVNARDASRPPLDEPDPLSAEAIARCLATLEALRHTPADDPTRVTVERAVAHLTKSAKQKRRLARKQENRRLDRAQLATTARAAAYFAPVLDQALPTTSPVPAISEPATAEPERELHNQRHCYVCKRAYRRVHAFYHALCEACAERNFAARGASADLTGRRAIVTGGRFKIGFEIAASLLRAGARVTITTRFPRDAERRYDAAVEAGVLERAARERLAIAGLDFLDVRGVLAWIEAERERGEPLDVLINNAAQTVRRPAAYYAELLAGEDRPALVGDTTNALEVVDRAMFPRGVDEEGKPIDLRARNSWVMTAGEIDPAELAEVHVVNAIVPFLLANRLRPLMTASEFADRYIVNVSAMEGVFAYANKQPRHPHTNMAKAALNMFTRTSAADFVRDGIYMNSVDTGWITEENPHPLKQRLAANGFCPPLDIVDGAARVLAPVYRGVQGDRVAGAFFKDYEPAPW